MSLFEYLRVLIQRGWIVVLIVMFTAGGAYFLTTQQTRIFQSSYVILLEPVSPNSNISQANRALLNGYVVYLYSRPIAAQVVEALDMGISPDELMGRSSISVTEDQLALEIRVNDTDGENANRVALAWGEALIHYRNTINEDLPGPEHINAIPQDSPRFSQFRPRVLLTTALGVLGGLAVGGLIVFMLEFLHNRIVQHPEDLEQGLHMDVLATIPGDA